MQISNASMPFPNAVAPFTPKVDPPSSGVTKDILISSFSPVSESQSIAPSYNSLSEKTAVYSPESLAQAANVQTATASANPPISPSQGKTPSDEGAEETNSSQPAGKASQVVVQPSSEEAGGEESTVNGDSIAAPASEEKGGTSSSETSGVQPASTTRLTPEELEVVNELAARDREVRTHEQQHQAVGGAHAGAASFSYQTGPDGLQYAVGGEVSIDISAVPNNPQATIEKMRTVKNAALAPAEPSAQDRSVASAANRMILQAQSELAAQKAEEFQTVRAEAEQRRVESAEKREQQDQQNDQQSINDGVRTYESLIELGQRYANGLTPEINLDEVV